MVRTLSWICMAAGLALISVWLYSGWYSAVAGGGAASAFLSEGVLECVWVYDRRGQFVYTFPIDGVMTQRHTFELRWFVLAAHAEYGRAFIRFAVWMPAAVCLAAAGVLRLCASRRCTASACHECGYSLIGNITAVCPECGTPTHTHNARGARG